MRWEWERPPWSKVVRAVSQFVGDSKEKEASPVLGHPVPHRVEQLRKDKVARPLGAPREMLRHAELVIAFRILRGPDYSLHVLH